MTQIYLRKKQVTIWKAPPLPPSHSSSEMLILGLMFIKLRSSGLIQLKDRERILRPCLKQVWWFISQSCRMVLPQTLQSMKVSLWRWAVLQLLTWPFISWILLLASFPCKRTKSFINDFVNQIAFKWIPDRPTTTAWYPVFSP